MSHNGGKRITENALMWLVIVLSLALLTPWGIAQRHMLQPRLALVSVVLSTLAGAAFLVNAVLTVFSKRGGWRAAALPSCFAVSLFLLANTFVWGAKSSSAQSYTLGGAAVFMIAAAVLQHRARERSESL